MPEDMVTTDLPPFRVWNRGGPRPVLALHCSLAHSGAWQGLAERLEGVTVTATDQPSHGRAPDWDRRTDLHGLSTRLSIAMAEDLGQGAAIDLVGHSFGATIALWIALQRPDLVRSLTLVEPVIFAAARSAEDPAYAPFKAAHLAFAEQVKAGAPESAAAMFHAMWGTGSRFADLTDKSRLYMVNRIHLIVAQTPVLLEDAAGLLHFMGLEAIGVPVLLIEGAMSPPIIAAVHTELARRLPNVTRLSVHGAGHMVPITHPEIVASAVQTHLDSC